MAYEAGSVIIRILGDVHDLDTKLLAAGKGLKSFGTAVKQAGMGLTAVLTVPIAAGAIAAVKAGEEIDTAYKKIAAQTGATGEKLKGLTSSFDNLFGDLPNKSQDVAVVIAEVSDRLGGMGVNVQEVSKDILNMARMSGESAEKVSSGITSMITSWAGHGLELNKVNEAMDYMYTVSVKTHVPIATLTKDVDQAATALQLMGFGWKESVALMAQFEQAGLSINDLIRGMEYGWAGLQKALGAPGPKTSKKGVTAEPSEQYEAGQAVSAVIKELGLDATKSKDQMTALFYGIEKGLITDEMAVTIFGKRFAAAFTGSIKAGKLSMDEWLKLVDATPISLDAAALASYNLNDKLTILKHNLTLAFAPFGIALVETLTSFIPFVKIITDGMMTLGRAFNELPAPVKLAIFAFAGFLAAIGPVTIGVGILINSLGRIIIPFAKLGTVATGVSLAFMGIDAKKHVSNLNLMGRAHDALAPGLTGLKVGLNNVVMSLSGGVGAGGLFTSAISGITAALPALAIALAVLGVPLALLAMGIAGMAAGFAYAYLTSGRLRDIIDRLGEAFNVALPHIQTALAALLSGDWDTAKENITQAWEGIKSALGTIDWANVGQQIINQVNQGIITYKPEIFKAFEDFATEISRSIEAIPLAEWESIGTKIGSFILNALTVFFTSAVAGERALNALITGMGGAAQGEELVEVTPGVFQNTRGGASWEEGVRPGWGGLIEVGKAAAAAFIEGVKKGLTDQKVKSELQAAMTTALAEGIKLTVNIGLDVIYELISTNAYANALFEFVNALLMGLPKIALGVRQAEKAAANQPSSATKQISPGVYQDTHGGASWEEGSPFSKVQPLDFQYGAEGGIVQPQPGGVLASVSGQQVIVGEAGEAEAIIPQKYWGKIAPSVLRSLPRFGKGGVIHAADGWNPIQNLSNVVGGTLKAGADWIGSTATKAAEGLVTTGANVLGGLINIPITISIKLVLDPASDKKLLELLEPNKSYQKNVALIYDSAGTSQVLQQVFGQGDGAAYVFKKAVALVYNAEQTDLIMKQVFGQGEGANYVFKKAVAITKSPTEWDTKMAQIFDGPGGENYTFKKAVAITEGTEGWDQKMAQIFAHGADANYTFKKGVAIIQGTEGWDPIMKKIFNIDPAPFTKKVDITAGDSITNIQTAIDGIHGKAITIDVNYVENNKPANAESGAITVPRLGGGVGVKGYQGGGISGAVPGGRLVYIAEGGEGEAIIPQHLWYKDWDTVLRALPKLQGGGIAGPRGFTVPSFNFERAKAPWEREETKSEVNYNAYVTVDSENIKREVFKAFQELETYHHIVGR